MRLDSFLRPKQPKIPWRKMKGFWVIAGCQKDAKSLSEKPDMVQGHASSDNILTLLKVDSFLRSKEKKTCRTFSELFGTQLPISPLENGLCSSDISLITSYLYKCVLFMESMQKILVQQMWGRGIECSTSRKVIRT